MARKQEKKQSAKPHRASRGTGDPGDRRQSPAGRPDREAAEDAGSVDPRDGLPPVVGEDDFADEHRLSRDRDRARGAPPAENELAADAEGGAQDEGPDLWAAHRQQQSRPVDRPPRVEDD
jgi:hypothetical protein